MEAIETKLTDFDGIYAGMQDYPAQKLHGFDFPRRSNISFEIDTETAERLREMGLGGELSGQLIITITAKRARAAR